MPDREIADAQARFFSAPEKSVTSCVPSAKSERTASTAIVFVEQLYPFRRPNSLAEFERHPKAREIVWVQEEPANMGALITCCAALRPWQAEYRSSVKRSASASPATGSAKAHEVEQKALLSLALGNGKKSRPTAGLPAKSPHGRQCF